MPGVSDKTELSAALSLPRRRAEKVHQRIDHQVHGAQHQGDLALSPTGADAAPRTMVVNKAQGTAKTHDKRDECPQVIVVHYLAQTGPRSRATGPAKTGDQGIREDLNHVAGQSPSDRLPRATAFQSNARVRMVARLVSPRLLRFQPIAKIPRATASGPRPRPTARLEPCGFQFPKDDRDPRRAAVCGAGPSLAKSLTS